MLLTSRIKPARGVSLRKTVRFIGKSPAFP